MRGDICTMWRVCAKWLQVDDGNGDGDGNVGVDGLVDRSIMQCMYARDFKGAAGCTRMRFKQYNCWAVMSKTGKRRRRTMWGRVRVRTTTEGRKDTLAERRHGREPHYPTSPLAASRGPPAPF